MIRSFGFRRARALLLFAVVALPAVAARLPRPAVYDITKITLQPTSPDAVPGDVRLAGGKTLPLGMTWAPGQKVLFEDLMPGANWSHPARYKVVGQDGRVLNEAHAELPPADLADAVPLDAEVGSQPEEIRYKLNDYGGALKVKDPSHFFALLINGNADLRHWNDFSFLYRVLTRIYGYLPAQIFVADGTFRERRPDLDGDGKPDILYGSTVAEIKALFAKLQGVMKKEDHLLIVVNDHGSTSAGESTILFQDGEMKASDFASLLRSLPVDKMLAIYEQCYGGGFVRPTVDGQRVAMSASQNNEYSWATEDLNFDEFLYRIISAFAGQTHDGAPVASAKLTDGHFSAKDAFAFALGADKAAENPLLETSSNTGASPHIGLNF